MAVICQQNDFHIKKPICYFLTQDIIANVADMVTHKKINQKAFAQYVCFVHDLLQPLQTSYRM